MQKLLFFFFFTLLTSFTAVQAQNYDRAIGGRMGLPAGVAYKQFVSQSLAFEGIVGIYLSGRGFDATFLIENHIPVFNNDLTIFYGGGGHIGSYDDRLNLGVDGIGGLEYTFPKTPISFSFDAKPSIGFIGKRFGFIPGGGFSLRYVW